MECKLIDGVEMNKEYPDTFWIPSSDHKEAIECGNFVKIGLENEDVGGERFWVEITEIQNLAGITVFTGKVDNDLVKFGNLYPYRSDISFYSENVLDILV